MITYTEVLRDQFTVKLEERLTGSPLTVTAITPSGALVGTVATMAVLVALVSVADVPLNLIFS